MKLSVKNRNYCFTVVKVGKDIPLEGRDRIVHKNIFGNMVITQKDSLPEETLALYIPVETQLSEDYCKYNNLYDKSEMNVDTTKRGYISHKRRIRAIKLGGFESNGMLMPLDSIFIALTEVGTIPLKKAVESFKEGDEFDTIDGVELCRKYVVPVRNSNSGGKQPKQPKKISKLVDGQFKLHVDTDQLGKNIHKINPNDLISITYKIHGCLQYDAPIKMYNGSVKKIKDILTGDVVLGYDESSECFIPSKVLNTFINGYEKNWFKIKTGYLKSTITCTGNHKIFTQNGYIKASDLSINDKVLIHRKGKNLCKLQKQFLLGKALGDGYIGSNSQFKKIEMSHKLEHKDYLYYCLNMLGSLKQGTVYSVTSGYGSKMIRGKSIQDVSINNCLKNYLSDKHKFIITESLIEDLNPLSLAVWYMDDGSLSHHKSQKDRANLAICRYSDDDIVIFKKALIQMGFDNYAFYKSNNSTGVEHWRLRFNHSDACKLFEMIKEYIPPAMQYKLPEEFRGFYKESIPEDLGEKIYPVWSNIQSIIEYCPSKRYNTMKYDIETETHNFITNNTLVHNSSGISSRCLVKRKLNWFEKLLKLLGVKIVQTHYDGYGIFSSRKVVQNEDLNPNTNDYYKDDSNWRKIAHEMLIPFMANGMTLYYEIAGYIPNGSAIQKNYDYGCEVGEFKIFIYRITSTNTDGQVLEWSSKQVQDWCKQNELQAVPELYYGYIGTLIYDEAFYGDFHEYTLERLKDFWKNQCSICKSKVPSEGIVLRKEGLQLEVYKYKNFRFLEYESKRLDSGEANIEDNENT